MLALEPSQGPVGGGTGCQGTHGPPPLSSRDEVPQGPGLHTRTARNANENQADVSFAHFSGMEN